MTLKICRIILGLECTRSHLFVYFKLNFTATDRQHIHAPHRPVIGRDMQRLSHNGRTLLLGLQNETRRSVFGL
jgi:hypothetical protein